MVLHTNTIRDTIVSAHCCDHHYRQDNGQDPGEPVRQNAYRRVLWVVLTINAAMLVVEVGAGLAAGSAALQADALDFLGDAANYAISLFVVGMTLRYRATAALGKGATMSPVRFVGARRHLLARLARHAAARPDYGCSWLHALAANGASFAHVVAVSDRRRQYALGMDLHA